MKKFLALFIICIIAISACNDNKTDLSNDDPIIESLKTWLSIPVTDREPLESLSFSKEPLTKSLAKKATSLLLQDRQNTLLKEYEQQWKNRALKYNQLNMPFYYHVFGEKPSDGRSLFISMHGGGGAPASVNDQQFENQKHLYDQTMNTLEGVYFVPRAPTNTWNLWHQNHIDHFFNLVIQLVVALEDVNPDKVYLMGYSAGGDGVYQLAPRMADRWAAAAMMAGHPNETSPLSLKNLPFTIHVGALDDGFNRNQKALEWKNMLNELERDNPGSYIHEVHLHKELAHWMKLEDAVALPWMKKFQRNPIPQSVVWKQDDRHHDRFYWLGTPDNMIDTGGEIVAEYNPQANEINISSNYSSELQLYMNDAMLNLDQPVTIKFRNEVIARKMVNRYILNIYHSLSKKGDMGLSFPGVITILNNQEIKE